MLNALILTAALAPAFDFGGPRDILQASELHALADELSELAEESRALEDELESAYDDWRKSRETDEQAQARLDALLMRGEALSEKAASARRKAEDLDVDSDKDVVDVAKRRLREQAEDYDDAVSALLQTAGHAAGFEWPRWMKQPSELTELVEDAEREARRIKDAVPR